MHQDLSGILPVLPTPFTEEGGVDAAAMRRILRFALDAGVDGVVFPGFASEVETLSAGERETLLRVCVEEVGDTVPIVAGASAPTAEEVIGHGRQAVSMGVRHLMIQPPKTLGSSAEAVAGFMGEVSRGLPEARIILQNAPAPRGSDLSPETILAVVGQIPAITYVKEETLPAGPAISRMLEDAPSHLAGVIGGGGARYILDEYARGACAAMPALEIAAHHVALDRAYRSGDRELAREIYVRTLPLLALQAVYRMRLTKHVLMRRGVCENTIVRAPTPELDAQAIADIDACLAEIDALALPTGAASRMAGAIG
ncbi:dihydrodipicolinate synthase family protein [Chelativorans sp. AA-79]|uniref:dihydrodipicolinate synthase family protein n=1 Tax=Chelativorans sp. AA-79 TaxID=3028735 RepID=UPI0023F79BBB|nr:dihydrodipicolinate synthase family protein [Chelativorans sp. AA-79]WEX11061.1 dihydrodipicolinate synthase family protein [Chelativorans sp. AA-79]